jgi:hypothetical protein
VENIGRLVNKFRCAVTGCLYIDKGIDLTFIWQVQTSLNIKMELILQEWDYSSAYHRKLKSWYKTFKWTIKKHFFSHFYFVQESALIKKKSCLTKMCVMWWFCGVIIFCSNTWTSVILNYHVLYTWLIPMKKLQNVKKPIIFCSVVKFSNPYTSDVVWIMKSTLFYFISRIAL